MKDNNAPSKVNYIVVIITLSIIVAILATYIFTQLAKDFLASFQQSSIFTGVLIGLLTTWALGLAIFFIQRKEFKYHEKECFSRQDSNINEIKEFCSYLDEKEKAGIDTLFHTRDDHRTTITIMNGFVKYMEKGEPEKGTLKILGTTLRAFTIEKGMYYPLHESIRKLYSQQPPDKLGNSNIQPETDDCTNLLIRLLKYTGMNIQMIVLNPYCLESYIRAQAEDKDPSKPFDSIDEFRNQDSPCLYSDIKGTINFVKKVQKSFSDRIEIKLSFFMNAMFLVIFPDYCFSQQYIMDKFSAKGGTSQIPLIKYRGKSNSYDRLKYHFDTMWNQARVLDTKSFWGKGTAEGFMFDIYKEIAPQKSL